MLGERFNFFGSEGGMLLEEVAVCGGLLQEVAEKVIGVTVGFD